MRLYLPRSALPATAEDEYYHADLIGLEAVLGDGTPVGRVRAIHDFGAGDTLELARPGAPPLMVPFTRASCRWSTPAEGRLVVDPPPGLLERCASGMTWQATVLTIFPEMLPGPLAYSLAGKALKAGLWRLETVDIRDFARDKHRSVDDAPFGGGPGMVMRPDVSMPRSPDRAVSGRSC